jgi:hypothetical protein
MLVGAAMGAAAIWLRVSRTAAVPVNLAAFMKGPRRRQRTFAAGVVLFFSAQDFRAAMPVSP